MTGNGVSFKEQAANRMERQGRILNAAQIEGMRKVCRVRPPWSLLSPCLHS